MKNDPVNVAFGKNLAIERKRSGVTQEELGRRVGIVRTTIANLEAGRQNISLPLLYRIALALGNDLNSLLPPLETGSEAVLDKARPGEMNAKNDGDWTERVKRKPLENKIRIREKT